MFHFMVIMFKMFVYLVDPIIPIDPSRHSKFIDDITDSKNEYMICIAYVPE